MIRIRRPANAPAALSSPPVVRARDTIKGIAANRKPMSKEFPTLWGNKDVRQALWAMQNKKCAYCERRRDVNRESDIDHFRPKAEVTLAPAHSGYWWLAYDWKNLLFCCRHCNQSYKLNHFPVENEADRVSSEDQPLARERAYLIDPCSDVDDPEDCLAYHVNEAAKLVYIVPRPENAWNKTRAEKTIEILKLNRPELLDERGKCVTSLRLLVTKMHAARQIMAQDKEEEAKGEIRQETNSSQPFAGFRRAFFRVNGLGAYVSAD
jgi:uncharacterized protein (TIGR02646 family)